MDGQKLFAVLFFFCFSGLMFYYHRHVDKAIAIYTKLYGVFGIRMDFSHKGKVLVKVVTLLLSVLFFVGAVAVLLFE